MTNDMEKELTSVRVKYKGQCPYEKGHEVEGFTFIAGLFIGLLIAIASNCIQTSLWERWAIKNEYANYNQQDGHIQWLKP